MLLQLLVGEDKLMSMADALDDIKRKFQGFSPLHYGEVGSHAKCCPLVHLGVEHDRPDVDLLSLLGCRPLFWCCCCASG